MKKMLIVILCIPSLMMQSYAEKQESHTFVHKMTNNGILKEVSIKYCIDKEEVGDICYAKVPCLNYYIVHSLYIHPESRNNGYGRNLLNYACECLSSIGARKIYIQPGPFEFDKKNDIRSSTNLYKQKLQQLVTLYENCGFVFVGKLTSCMAALLYRYIGIQEDADYLMAKTLY